MLNKISISQAFKPASVWAEEYREHTGRGGSRRTDVSRRLQHFALMGDAIVGMAASEAVLRLKNDVATSGHLIGKTRSNKYMSWFSKEIGLFEHLITSSNSQTKKRADLLEGYFGHLYYTQGLEASLLVTSLYIDYVICFRDIFNGPMKFSSDGGVTYLS